MILYAVQLEIWKQNIRLQFVHPSTQVISGRVHTLFIPILKANPSGFSKENHMLCQYPF
jgi:hypothetical protein